MAFVIAANVLSDRWRRAATRQEAVNDDLDQIGIEDDIEQRAILYQLVDTLPDDQRRVIIRRFVGQKSLREIANGTWTQRGCDQTTSTADKLVLAVQLGRGQELDPFLLLLDLTGGTFLRLEGGRSILKQLLQPTIEDGGLQSMFLT